MTTPPKRAAAQGIGTQGISADDFADEVAAARGERSGPRASFDDLVYSAVRGAGLVLVVKVLAVLILARLLGATVGLDFWYGVVPHLQFTTEPSTFTLIVTLSTLAMAAAALVLAALTFFEVLDDSRQRVLGRGVASVIALQTFGLELYRHYSQDATIRWSFAWLVVLAGLGGITLLVISLWKDRGGELNSEKETKP